MTSLARFAIWNINQQHVYFLQPKIVCFQRSDFCLENFIWTKKSVVLSISLSVENIEKESKHAFFVAEIMVQVFNYKKLLFDTCNWTPTCLCANCVMNRHAEKQIVITIENFVIDMIKTLNTFVIMKNLYSIVTKKLLKRTASVRSFSVPAVGLTTKPYFLVKELEVVRVTSLHYNESRNMHEEK